MDDQNYVYKSTLKKDHGFTDKTIAALGAPDKTAKNPHYKSGPPASLFLLSRALIYKEEHPEQFATEATKARRQASARKAVATKVETLLHSVEGRLELVRPLPSTFSELRRIATDHANSRHDNAFPPGFAGICATVRHEFTNYEELLATIKAKCGSSQAYEAIREELDEMVEALIGDKYPEET